MKFEQQSDKNCLVSVVEFQKCEPLDNTFTGRDGERKLPQPLSSRIFFPRILAFFSATGFIPPYENMKKG